ncbi:MAG: hypothetical protein CSA82_03430 [Actinobacteria bacterium]|nr:MAG: hypothetical protein CSA82_03430 [Actinomycetota bacterium]
MSLSTTFTPSSHKRYPAPDVARGFMLLLIALANITFWVQITTGRAVVSQADQIWLFLRTALIDHRAYPLFSMLLGFGLSVMATNRYNAARKEASSKLNPLPEGSGDITLAVQEMAIDEYATTKAFRLLMRRGWWMLLIGAIHCMFFIGDIIGTYAAGILIFAILIVKNRQKTILIIGMVIAAINWILMSAVSYVIKYFPEIIPKGANDIGGTFDYSPVGILTRSWMGLVSPLGLIMTPIVLCIALGVYIHRSGIMENPWLHRTFLLRTAAGGLTLAVAMSIPQGMHVAQYWADPAPWWAYVVTEIGGVFGALGWLALLTVWAGPAPEDGELRGARWFFAMVGRRSMTVYLGQTVLFIAIFAYINANGAPVPAILQALIAFLVWFVLALGCVALEHAGKRGPFEWLLRTLVARSEKPYEFVDPTLPAESHPSSAQ